MSASAVRWYHSNAPTRAGEAQEDPLDCLGGLRSATPVYSLEVQRDRPMRGILVRYAAGANGPGIGTLTADSADTLNWTPPGGAAGASVTLTLNVPSVLYGDDENQWIEVERISTAALSGSEALTLVDCFEGAIGFGEVLTADATAGEDYYDSIFGYVVEDVTVEDLTVWIDTATDGYELADETPSSSAIQTIADINTAPAAVSWNSGTTSGTGINLGTFTLGDDIGVWLHKAIGAATDGAYGVLVTIHYQYTVGATTYAGVHRNRYNIERTDQAGFGMWVGEDAEPDWTAAYDEFFTEADLDYDTTFTVTVSHVYYVGFRRLSAYGLWETNFETEVFDIASDGTLNAAAPSAPEDLSVTPTSGGKVIIAGRYYPAPDGTNRATVFELYFQEASAPSSGGTPDAFAIMGNQSGIEQFTYTTVLQLGGAEIYAIARTIRFDSLGLKCESEGTQLPASGAGSIGGDFTDWPASGYCERRTIMGELLETFTYTSRTDSLLTVGTARGLFGTTEQASVAGELLEPVKAVYSSDSAAASGTVVYREAPKPLVVAIMDSQAGILQTPDAGPNETVVIDAGENVYWDNQSGSLWFWMDTVLGFRIILDTRTGISGWYFPNDVWAIDKTVDVSASSSGELIEVVSASDVYFAVNGSRKMRFNLGSNVVQLYGTAEGPDAVVPSVFATVPAWSRYAETMINCWNPHHARYEPAGALKSDGSLHTSFVIDNATYSQAQLEAL